jgi:hypothetical protein
MMKRMLLKLNITGSFLLMLALGVISGPVVAYDQGDPVVKDCLENFNCTPFMTCPYMRACFGNCDVGKDNQVVGRRAGAFFANLIGVEVQTTYDAECIQDCVAKKDDYCAGKQPIDIMEAPLPDDPKQVCLQYCGGADNINGRFGWCIDSCNNLSNISACYAQHKTDTETACKADDFVDFSGMINDPSYSKHGPNAVERFKGFINEVLCARTNNKAAPCATLCKVNPRSRVCAEQNARRALEEERRDVAREVRKNEAVASSRAIADTTDTTADTAESEMKAYEALNKRLEDAEDNK